MNSAETILSIPLFHGISREQAKDLAAACTVTRYRGGERVISEGEAGRLMFIVLRGRLEVSRLNDNGDRVLFHELGPGGFFGEMSLLAGIPRTADVTTLKPTQLMVIERDNFRRCVLNSPDVAMRIIGHLALRVHQSDSARIAKRSVRQRLVEAILEMAETDGAQAVLQVPRTALGERILARRETVSRELASLARENLVRLDGKTIVIPFPDRLRRRG